MINHVRTLILNRSSALAGIESGIDYAEYIDPDFSPIRMGPALAAVRAMFIPDNLTIQQELASVAYIMHVLHTPELEAYVLDFDKRITYDLGIRTASPINDLVTSLQLITAHSISGTLAATVFAPWDGAPDLVALRQTWYGNTEATLRAGSILLGLSWQCERIRVGGVR